MADDARYSVFGLTVSSEVPLPDLPFLNSAAAPDLTVRRGEIAAGDDGAGLHGDAGRAVLTVPGVARFEVRAGREIVVETCQDAEERHVRLFLLGSALGVVLHQRKLLPLHANAVEIGGRAVAIVGQSGAGKSTLAAWFHDRGRRVLTDDVCVVRWSAGGEPIASPGIPRLRLWRDALHRSGRRAESFEPTWLNDESYDKFDVPLDSGSESEVVPLDRVYLLRRSDQPAEIVRLRGAAAVNVLVSNTYRGAFVRQVGDPADHWRQCVALAAAVPVFELARAFDASRFDDDARALEAHAAGDS